MNTVFDYYTGRYRSVVQEVFGAVFEYYYSNTVTVYSTGLHVQIPVSKFNR